jgi:hypothetical protein
MFSFVVRQLRWLAGLTQMQQMQPFVSRCIHDPACYSIFGLGLDVQHSHFASRPKCRRVDTTGSHKVKTMLRLRLAALDIQGPAPLGNTNQSQTARVVVRGIEDA